MSAPSSPQPSLPPSGAWRIDAATAQALASGRRSADLGACRDLPAALAELGRALAFPAWYGANLDALHDCLSDPDWPAGAGIVVRGLDALCRRDPEGAGALIEVFASAAEVRTEAGSRLLILVETSAPALPPLPGA